MTLSTDIHILDKIEDPEGLHAWVNRELLKAENPIFTRKDLRKGEPIYENHPDWGTVAQDQHELNNRLGQGLDAIFELTWYDEAIAPIDYFDLDSEDEEHNTYLLGQAEQIGAPIWGTINFDTAYSYHGDFGMGCTELHAQFIIRLIKEYFEPRGMRVVWENEYAGTYHHGLDADGFNRFLGSGDSAMDWFTNTVKPAIEKAVGNNGKVFWK
jgi:hypothetical protein